MHEAKGVVFFVYKLTFVNGKLYIGMSKTDKSGLFTNRFRQHARSAKNGSKNPVHSAWRKHGAPTLSVLSLHATREECALAEVEAIKAHDALNPGKGYNLMAGGEGMNAPIGSAMYELMREKVWSNANRRAKLSAALKGRKPSDATLDAYRKWASTPEGKARKALAAFDLWNKPGYREQKSQSVRRQMTPEAREHLSRLHSGRVDPRTPEGKAAAAEKLAAYLATPEAKESARKGHAAMWSNAENRAKWKAVTDQWRSSERNREQCKQMAVLSAAACSKRVMDTRTGIEYASQRAMAKALGLSEAAISLRVKSGLVVRI